MYIILLVYSQNHYEGPITKIFHFDNKKEANENLLLLRDRCSSAGYRIFELKLYNQIINPHQIELIYK